MTLTKYIIDQLQPDISFPAGTVQASDDQFKVDVTLVDWDRLGCLIRKVEIGHSHNNAMKFDPAQIEDKITYLGEPLRVIELAEDGGRAVLRSAPPHRDGEKISFFELVLDQNAGLSLVRYLYDGNRGERISVPAALTRESLERLLADLIDVVEDN
jgi:hypothetical protein